MAEEKKEEVVLPANGGETPPTPAPEKTPEQLKSELEATAKELEQAQYTIVELKKKKEEAVVVTPPTPVPDSAEKIKADLEAKSKELEAAKLIISELKQTSISKKTTNTTGSAAGQELGHAPGEITEEMLTPKDKVIMARHGLTLKDINKK